MAEVALATGTRNTAPGQLWHPGLGRANNPVQRNVRLSQQEVQDVSGLFLCLLEAGLRLRTCNLI